MNHITDVSKKVYIYVILLTILLAGSAWADSPDSVGASSIEDAYMQHDNITYTKNQGTCPRWWIGAYSNINCYTAWNVSRQLVYFPITGVPADQVIDSAFIYTYLYAVGRRTQCSYSDSTHFVPYPVKRDWGEGARCAATAITGESSWQDAKYGSVAWSTGGAEGANDIYACSETDTAGLAYTDDDMWVKIPVTEFVKDLYDGTISNNYGVMIRDPLDKAASNYQIGLYQFGSTVYATTTQRPYVKIYYTATPACTSLIDPTSPTTTTSQSERYDSLHTGYGNPDTLDPIQYVDYSPKHYFTAADTDSVCGYYIQVGTDSTAGDTSMWSEKALFSPDTLFGDGDISPPIEYDGEVLQDGKQYFWRVSFLHGADSCRSNFTAWQTFTGVSPAWPDTTDGVSLTVQNALQRCNVRADDSHTAVSKGHTMSVKMYTGTAEIIDTTGFFHQAFDGSQQIAEFRDYVYMAYMATDTNTILCNYINRFNPVDRSWSGKYLLEDSLLKSGNLEAHYNAKLYVGKDSCLYALGSGHDDTTRFYKSDSTHITDSGINIEYWGSAVKPSVLRYATYPRWAMDSDGDFVVGFRDYINAGAPYADTLEPTIAYRGVYGYIRNTYSGGSYGGFGSRHIIAYSHEDPKGKSSMYNGGFFIDKNNRLHVLLIWFYGYSLGVAQSAGVSYVYSDPDVNGEYTYWYEKETADTVGNMNAIVSGTVSSVVGGYNILNDAGSGWSTDEWAEYCVRITSGSSNDAWRCIGSNTESTLTTYSIWDRSDPPATNDTYEIFKPIYYSSCSKVMVCYDIKDDTVVTPSPMSNTNNLIVESTAGDTDHSETEVFFTFNIDESDSFQTTPEYGRIESPIIFAKWDATDSMWLLDNLAGYSKFVADTVGDKNHYTITIEDGTASGIKVLVGNGIDSIRYVGELDTTQYPSRQNIDEYARGLRVVIDSAGVIDSLKFMIEGYSGLTCSLRLAVFNLNDEDTTLLDSTAHYEVSHVGASYISYPTLLNANISVNDTLLILAVSDDTLHAFRNSKTSTVYIQGALTAANAWTSWHFANSATNLYYTCEIVYSKDFAVVDTFDNIDNPQELRDRVDSSIVHLQWVGCELPDTCSKTTLAWGDDDDTTYSLLQVRGTGDYPKAWDYMKGGQMVYNDNQIYIYIVAKGSGEYFGGEWYRLVLRNVKGDNAPNYAGEWLSAGSASGQGRLCVVDHFLSNGSRFTGWSRGTNVVAWNDNLAHGSPTNGDDIRMVMTHNTGSAINYYELDRVFDFVQQESTTVYWMLPYTPITGIGTDSTFAFNKTFQLFKGMASPGSATEDSVNNPNDVFQYFQGWELQDNADTLNGVDGWISKRDSSLIASTFGGYTLSTNKVWGGDKAVRIGQPDTISRYMGADLANYELNIKIWTPAEAAACKLSLVNGSSWVGVGITSASSKVFTGDHTTGWDDTTRSALGTQYHHVKFVLDGSGVDTWVNSYLVDENNTSISSYDSLKIVTSGSQLFVLDNVEVTEWVADSPVMSRTVWENRFASGRRRLFIIKGD